MTHGETAGDGGGDVQLARLDPGVPLPGYALPGDAGADLTAAHDVELAPGERAIVGTGIAIALPVGYAAFVHPRSGLAAKHGVTLVNAPGTIDAGYRGEIKVILLNTDATRPVSLRRGDRIAQLVVQRVEHVSFREVTALPGSARGEDGFGSTGGPAGRQVRSGGAGTWGTRGGARGGATPRAESDPGGLAEPHSQLPRVDLGSILVPVLEGTDIQLVF